MHSVTWVLAVSSEAGSVGCQAGVRKFWSSKIACWELTSSCRPHPVGVDVPCIPYVLFVLIDTVVCTTASGCLPAAH